MPGPDYNMVYDLLIRPKTKSYTSHYKPGVAGSTRLIDRETTTRTIPMKVLNLGMSRTGTYCK